MRTTSLYFIPLVAALGLSLGTGMAQTGVIDTGGPGSSVTGGRSAPAAQPGTGTRNAETRKGDKLVRADRKFIQQAAEHGMFEVQIAQLASSKATSPAVKALADTLVNDHSNANNELVQFANSRNVELPAAPPRGKRKDLEQLAKLTGDDFDRRFVREVGIQDHEKDIRKFEKASEKAKDPQLKAWIDKTIYKMREHLAQAQKLPLGGDASAMGNRGAAPLTTGPAAGKSGAAKTGG
jgi:putative membrane protein